MGFEPQISPLRCEMTKRWGKAGLDLAGGDEKVDGRDDNHEEGCSEGVASFDRHGCPLGGGAAGRVIGRRSDGNSARAEGAGHGESMLLEKQIPFGDDKVRNLLLVLGYWAAKVKVALVVPVAGTVRLRSFSPSFSWTAPRT